MVKTGCAMVEIRAEEPDDYIAIHDINLKAFNQEDEPRLVEAIRKSTSFIPGLSLVALQDSKAIGHILFSALNIETESGDAPALSLAPIAVLPEYQNQGIGSMLVRRGLEESKSLGYKIVIVIGHPEYYPRFGFEPARAKGLETSFPAPDEAFMALELVRGALDGITGMVRFSPEFEEA
jgi:putative acetyltransferase